MRSWNLFGVFAARFQVEILNLKLQIMLGLAFLDLFLFEMVLCADFCLSTTSNMNALGDQLALQFAWDHRLL